MSGPIDREFFPDAREFRRARRRADLQTAIARLTNKSADLLCYSEIYEQLRAEDSQSVGIQEIPLDAIVGSVGRCADFTRTFLPLKDSAQQRWTGIKEVGDIDRLPPIEVYRLGEAYFVLDGNHRVSIARHVGHDTIRAHVFEVEAKVALSPQDQPDDLILKAEYAAFLEHTGLDETRPGADLQMTAPGQYRLLEEQIEVHRRLLQEERVEEISYQEAAEDWYETVYSPVIEVIRGRRLLRDFRDRTETDLYVWITKHRLDLEAELGESVPPESALVNLLKQNRFSPLRLLRRLIDRARDRFTASGYPET